MANPEHEAVVRKGAQAITKWREAHPGKPLDLKGTNLVRAQLFRADLSLADLSKAKLMAARLNQAALGSANLTGADLTTVQLAAADLTAARLTGAVLFLAEFFAAKLTHADLTGADLTLAHLASADLTGADLIGADLSSAVLKHVNLDGANVTGARLRATVIADCSLGQCVGLDAVKHEGPSSIGVDTLVKSFRGAGNRFTPELENFFINAGVPRELLAVLPQILVQVQYCNCFVCYGEPDKGFAERLAGDLKAKGVSCWLYSMDATPGERTWGEITRKRREAEKMVVLCSAPALLRDGVLKEIEDQIDEEHDKMVPVSLDNLWTAEGFRVMRAQRDLKPFLVARNYADFSAKSAYEVSLDRLLKGLERKDRQAT